MEKMNVDIVEFARKNGAFSSYRGFPDGLQYIGDNVEMGAEITYHELLFEDVYGYIRTWSFRVGKSTGKIIPDDDGFKFEIGGFNPDEMRKKLAMVDKVHHHKQIREWVIRASESASRDGVM